MIDSHCHLADRVFADDLGPVVDRARRAGLARVLCILAAGDAGEARQAETLLALWPDVQFAIGVHPHQAGQFASAPEEAAAAVERAIAGRAAARAIGEIGLDYHYDVAPRDVQRAVFGAQLRLARASGLPVVIHTREAEADTFAILREEGAGEVGGVFHCFTGDATRARRVLDLGFHVSFAGIVTFPRAGELRDAAAIVPADRLLVETDSPFLAPVPHRGRRNEPAWVLETIRAVAQARGQPPEAVGEAALATFAALFAP